MKGIRWVKSRWAWVGVNHEQVKIAFAVIAGLYVLVEYRSNQTEALVKRTMEFQARFGQTELLRSRLKLERYWLSPESAKDLDEASGSKNEKITKVILDHKLDGSVYVLADFFGQTVTCLKEDLCELKATCAVFKPYVVELRNTYFDLFKTWERRWGHNLGEGPFQYFSANCDKASRGWFWGLFGALAQPSSSSEHVVV
jgi:hypothetical protein